MPGKRKRGAPSADSKQDDGERSPTPTGSSTKKLKKELQYDPVRFIGLTCAVKP